MPQPPRRNRLPNRLQPPVVDTRVEDLADLRAAVASLQAELKPLPERLAGLAKSGEAQRKRLDAVAAAQAQTQELLRRLDERLGTPANPGLWQLAERLRGLLPRRGAVAARQEPAPAAAAPEVEWLLTGGRLAPGTRSVLVALFGLDEAARESLVDRLTAAAARATPPLLPVFLTETTQFAPMRRVRAPFEHLPLHGGDRQDAPRRDWQLYVLRRFAGLCAKWQPVQVVAFGPAATRQLAIWRASPQLPEAVRDLFAVTADPRPPALS